MEATTRGPSKLIRLAVALAYPFVLWWLLPKNETTVPILLIALGLPLIFRLVPRNWLYGARTLRTLCASEETCYRQNVSTGIAMVLVGVYWAVVVAAR